MSVFSQMGIGDVYITKKRNEVMKFCEDYNIPYSDIVPFEMPNVNDITFKIEIKCGGFVNLCHYPYKNLPKNICFGNMFDGTFVCSYSMLETMKGFPEEVGQLDVSYSGALKSIEYAPKLVNRDFVAIKTGLSNQSIVEHCIVKGGVICEFD